MKPETIKRAFTKRLDGYWEWELVIWMQEGMWADFIVKGRRPFRLKSEAVKDQAKALRYFK